jgi:hypothetical protein
MDMKRGIHHGAGNIIEFLHVVFLRVLRASA